MTIRCDPFGRPQVPAKPVDWLGKAGSNFTAVLFVFPGVCGSASKPLQMIPKPATLWGQSVDKK
jgi:hypothetical protein